MRQTSFNTTWHTSYYCSSQHAIEERCPGAKNVCVYLALVFLAWTVGTKFDVFHFESDLRLWRWFRLRVFPVTIGRSPCVKAGKSVGGLYLYRFLIPCGCYSNWLRYYGISLSCSCHMLLRWSLLSTRSWAAKLPTLIQHRTPEENAGNSRCRCNAWTNSLIFLIGLKYQFTFYGQFINQMPDYLIPCITFLFLSEDELSWIQSV